MRKTDSLIGQEKRRVWTCEWESGERGRERGRESTPTMVCMGVFHGRKNAVRNSFNCPNSASMLSLLTRPRTHTHTVDTYTYQSFCLHNGPLPTSIRLHVSLLFLANLHSQLWTLLTKMTKWNICLWPCPSPVKLIYVTLQTQQAHQRAQERRQKCVFFFWFPG